MFVGTPYKSQNLSMNYCYKHYSNHGQFSYKVFLLHNLNSMLKIGMSYSYLCMARMNGLILLGKLCWDTRLHSFHRIHNWNNLEAIGKKRLSEYTLYDNLYSYILMIVHMLSIMNGKVSMMSFPDSNQIYIHKYYYLMTVSPMNHMFCTHFMCLQSTLNNSRDRFHRLNSMNSYNNRLNRCNCYSKEQFHGKNSILYNKKKIFSILSTTNHTENNWHHSSNIHLHINKYCFLTIEGIDSWYKK